MHEHNSSIDSVITIFGSKDSKIMYVCVYVCMYTGYEMMQYHYIR